jgi:hypothetical protein
VISNLIPFFILIGFCFFFTNVEILSIHISTYKKHVVLILVCSILIIFAGGRWYQVTYGSVVFDYSEYEYLYKNPLSIGNFMYEYKNHPDVHYRKMDIGYLFISSFFSNYITSIPNWFFMIISLVSIFLFVKGIKRNNMGNIVILILFVFLNRLYFQYNFIIMRQALAMAIVWFAIPLIVERKLIKFVLVCFIASLIHFTALFFIITYWLPRFKFSNKFLIFTIPIIFVLGITHITDNVVFMGVEKIITTVVGADSGLITAYLLNDELKGINLFNFIEILPFFVLAIHFRREMCATVNGKLFFNMLVFYTLFLILTMNFLVLTRLSSYFIYSYFFVLSFAYRHINSWRIKVLLGYFLCFYFTVYAIRFLSSNFLIYGYNFFLFQ